MGWVIQRTAHDGKTRYTAMFRDPYGRTRSAGTFATSRDAGRAADRQGDTVSDGTWIDPAAGRITFQEYAEEIWLPSRHLEVTTRAGYQSYLRNHFVPYFGHMRLARIMPSTIQGWVTQAVELGLSPRSIAKYHVMLHSVFARAVRDRMIAFNPCENTELPKVVLTKTRTLTPEEFSSVLAAAPDRFKALVLTGIETGLRWGELVALRPRHIDFLRRTICVEETIVEVSQKDSPTGERMILKPYPKDDEPRTLRVSQDPPRHACSTHCRPRSAARRPTLPFPGDHRWHSTVPGDVQHPVLAPGRCPIRRRLPGSDARPAPRPRLLAARRRRRPEVRHGAHGPRPVHD